MKAVVVKRIEFDAAHYLPHYKGKCADVHGHRWVLEVGVSGQVDEYSGMVVDFSILKEALQPIVDNLDHKIVNTTVENPTAENIAIYILNWLQKNSDIGNMLEFVRVWETPDSYAEIQPEGPRIEDLIKSYAKENWIESKSKVRCQ